MKTFPRSIRPTRATPGSWSKSSAGFSLVEVMIASGVLVIGLLALTSTSVVVHSLDRSDEARQSAGQALRAGVERVHSISNRSIDDSVGWSDALNTALESGVI